MYVVNRTRGTYLGVNIQMANSFLSRTLGLYRHRQLQLGDGVFLIPCKSIHTIGLRYAIDVVFLDAADDVVQVFPNTRPGKIIWPVRGARSALEVPVGVLRSSETHRGDHVEFFENLDHLHSGGRALRPSARGLGRSGGKVTSIKSLSR